MQADGVIKRSKVKELYTFMGMGKKKATEVMAGDICAVVGLEDFNIGDTIADAENPEALPVINVDEPTMSMLFGINNSPFYGKRREVRHFPPSSRPPDERDRKEPGIESS